MNNALISLPEDDTHYSAGSISHPLSDQLHNEPTNLNEVVQENLIALKQKIENLQAIIRYDSLPIVKGEKIELSKLFNKLFNSIIDHPPVDNKLFIYIRSEKQKNEELDLFVPEGYLLYHVSIYTNIKTDSNWEQLHKHDIEASIDIVKTIKGKFNYNQIANTGCLYNIELFGKIL